MSDSRELTGWRIDNKPPVMTKRYEFDSYDVTRLFVNALADLSEETGYYPNLTYKQTQATVTIFTEEQTLSEKDFDFALATDKIGVTYSKSDTIDHE